MKKFLIVILALTMLLAGCKNEEKTPSYPVESFDMTFASRPSKVLCLNKGAEEALKVLGYGHSLLDNDEIFEDKNYPQKEEVIKASPDFVIVSKGTRESIKNALSEKGISYITYERYDNEDELLDFLNQLILIFEGNNDAPLRQEQLTFFFNETSSVLEDAAYEILEEKFENAPTFLFVTGENFAYTGDTMEGRFFEDLGFVNLASDRENYYVPFNTLPSSPDILIYPDSMENLPARLNSYLDISYDGERSSYQSPSLFSLRHHILEVLNDGSISLEGCFMPLPEAPSEEK